MRFAIGGDLRFLSHRDVMRLFERALARAQWPVRFTEGFNPRPRLSLPLPRSVGTAGDDELLVVELDRPIDPEAAIESLARQVPAGITLAGGRAATTNTPPQARRAWYEVCVDTPPADLDAAIGAFLSRPSCPVLRDAQEGRDARQVDIRPYVESLVRTGDRIDMVLRITPQGAARPTEVLGALGLPATGLAHRLRRTRVEWSEPIPP